MKTVFQENPLPRLREELVHKYRMAIGVIKHIPVGIPIVLTLSKVESVGIRFIASENYSINTTTTTLCIVRNLFIETMQIDIIASSSPYPVTHPKYLHVKTWKKLTKEDMPLYIDLITKRPLFDELMKNEWIFQ